MHPVGPHTSTVYWVRRVALIVVSVGLVIGLIWWLAGRGSADTADAPDTETSTISSAEDPVLTGVLAAPTFTDDIYDDVPTADDPADLDDPDETDDGSGPVTITGSTAPTTADDSTPTDESDQPTSTEETTPPKPDTKKAEKTSGPSTDKATEAGADQKSTKKADKSAKDKPAADKPAEKPTKTVEAPPPPSYDEAGRLICADSAISVTGITWADTYSVGSQPRLGMAVTNTGTESCVRDLSGAIQTYTVYTAKGDRVWSTADCFPGEGHEVRMLTPGSTANFIVVWAGTTSEPGCAAPRTPVKAGKYVLVAKLGALKSAKHPFQMR